MSNRQTQSQSQSAQPSSQSQSLDRDRDRDRHRDSVSRRIQGNRHLFLIICLACFTISLTVFNQSQILSSSVFYPYNKNNDIDLNFDGIVHDALAVFKGDADSASDVNGVNHDDDNDDNDGNDDDGNDDDGNDDDGNDDENIRTKGDGADVGISNPVESENIGDNVIKTNNGDNDGANQNDDDDDDDDDDDSDDGDVDGVNNNNIDGTNNENPKNPRKMNVLIFYPDDWRHDTIGSEKPYVLTPFLDSLAKEGIRFTQNAVTSSVCWMSRATLWMGQYTSRHQSYKLKCPRFGTRENWKHSWIKLLQNAGYFIGHVGKWQYYSYNTRGFFDWSRLFEGHHWEKRYGSDQKVHASELAKEYAIKFFDERPKDQNFVLSIAFYPPKPVGDGRAPGIQWSPTNETRKLYDNVTIPEPETEKSFKLLPKFLDRTGPARGRFIQRYGTSEHFQASMKNYYALVTGVDNACKEIVDKLKEEGLYNNTMIIFTTDNGMFHGAHGLAGKWYPYQESIRVPLIIYDPRMPKEKVGTLDDSFTLNVDLAETILGATGVKPDELMQGRDISDLYLPNEKNEFHDTASASVEPWREDFFYEFPSPEEQFIPSSTALVRKDWKYIFWPVYNREQLFYLKEDPLELNDLYMDGNSTIILEDMRKRHAELKGELHDELYKDDPKCSTWNAKDEY